MGVEVRVEGTTGAVDESCGHYTGGGYMVGHASPSSAHTEGYAFEVTDGIGNCSLMRGTGGIGEFPRSEQVQDADRLGCAEH